MKDLTNETVIRKAMLIAVAKRYQKLNHKVSTGQEILGRAPVLYDPMRDEFHSSDIGRIDSQQAYFKGKAFVGQLLSPGAPSTQAVQPM